MSKNKKDLLFSLTKKDFEIETFRSGGPGGQNQNKRSTGVRIKHPDSGAVAESRNYRTQEKNKQAAFKRLVKTDEFKKWHKIKTGYALLGIADFKKHIENQIDNMMRPENLKIEIGDDIEKI
ncbi:MAG: peptide chain release factor family protein [bacterium]